jgi:SWI/SNF-related matrix-associated actin-dependent regulator of chromatin subfamily A-like protein 1
MSASGIVVQKGQSQLRFKCVHCGKQVSEVNRFRFGDYWSLTLECGHSMLLDALIQVQPEETTWEDFKSIDGRQLYKFQREGAAFAIEANGRCLIADEMGLGKTVQALAFVWKMLHSKKAFKTLVVTKSTLKYQWSHEAYRFLGEKDGMNQVIENKNQKPLTEFGFNMVIVSFDMLRRCAWVEDEEFMKNRFDCVIIDETQNIKNPSASRTAMVRKLARFSPYVIGLSGTPIKNNALEYFTILNILKPERFPSYKSFEYNYINTYTNGGFKKAGGLIDPEHFKEKTQDFIIRRTQDEVMPDLPKLNRTYRYAELGPEVEQAYATLMRRFEKAMNAEGGMKMMGTGGILEYMTHMKHLTGLAKVEPVVDFVTDFLMQCDRKIVIFRHHNDVHGKINALLSDLCVALNLDIPIDLTSDQSPQERHEIVMQFKDNPKARVLIASTLASGEGLNLQFCSDCIMVEQQWNPANEEQAEARFKRIGSEASVINATYQIALGTIDEYLADLKAAKRHIIEEALTGEKNEEAYSEQAMMKELAEILITKGMDRWRL